MQLNSLSSHYNIAECVNVTRIYTETSIKNHAKLLVMYLFIADFDPGSTIGSKLTIVVHTERKQNLVII